MSRSLALIVSTDPRTGDLDRAIELARSARAAGVDVSVFFMSDAVAGLPARRGAIAALDADGCDLFACAHSAEHRQLGESDVGVLLGSQDDHAAIVARSDRVVALT